MIMETFIAFGLGVVVGVCLTIALRPSRPAPFVGEQKPGDEPMTNPYSPDGQCDHEWHSQPGDGVNLRCVKCGVDL